MTKSSGLTASEAALIGAGIAAMSALFTALLSAAIQRHLAARRERTDAARARADHITEQISTLYGPLRLWTAQSRELAAKLKETKPESWNLLDNIDAVLRDPVDAAIARQIIDVNSDIEKLLLTHAGFLRDGQVDSYIEYLGHTRLLRVAFKAAEEDHPIPVESYAGRFEYYPAGFDDEIDSSYKSLQDERARLLSG